MRKIKKLALKLYKILFWLSGKSFNKDHSLIIFESFLGKQFSDNPRALYDVYTLSRVQIYVECRQALRKSV